MLKFILTDIEGTTTDVDFVLGILFPYFMENIDLLDHCSDETARDLAYQDVIDTVAEEEKRNISDIADIKQQLLFYCKTDRKHPALKKLQGMVWKEGYLNGDLKAHLYSDVVPNLVKWKDENLQLGVYSSGSVQAQHLLFEHSVNGDIKELFSAFYDTHVGHKREVESYNNIAKDLGIDSKHILFLSDIEEELEAAEKAGMKGVLLCRNEWKDDSQYFTAKDFYQVSQFIEKEYGI